MEISVMRRQKFHSIKSYFLIDDWDEGDDDNDDYDDYISLSQSIYQVQNDIESCWSINCDVFSVSNGFNCHCYYGQRWYANDERWNIEIRALKNVLLFRLLISASIQLFVFLELICSRIECDTATPQFSRMYTGKSREKQFAFDKREHVEFDDRSCCPPIVNWRYFEFIWIELCVSVWRLLAKSFWKKSLSNARRPDEECEWRAKLLKLLSPPESVGTNIIIIITCALNVHTHTHTRHAYPEHRSCFSLLLLFAIRCSNGKNGLVISIGGGNDTRNRNDK